MKKMNNKGFTLVELMVVIVIIGVLAAVAIPKFMNASHKAKIAEIPTILASVQHAQDALIAETGTPSATWATLGLEDPTPESKWWAYDIPPIVANTANWSATGKLKTTAQVGPINIADVVSIAYDHTKNAGSKYTREAKGTFEPFLPNWK